MQPGYSSRPVKWSAGVLFTATSFHAAIIANDPCTAAASGAPHDKIEDKPAPVVVLRKPVGHRLEFQGPTAACTASELKN
jgi:hypothetical protein